MFWSEPSDEPVGRVREEGRQVVDKCPTLGTCGRTDEIHSDVDEEHEVIEREDAQRPSDIEVAQIYPAVPIVLTEQQRRDQEATDHEEQVDAQRTP